MTHGTKDNRNDPAAARVDDPPHLDDAGGNEEPWFLPGFGEMHDVNADVDHIQQMFPQLTRRTIMAELVRTGSVEETVERIVEGLVQNDEVADQGQHDNNQDRVVEERQHVDERVIEEQERAQDRVEVVAERVVEERVAARPAHELPQTAEEREERRRLLLAAALARREQ